VADDFIAIRISLQDARKFMVEAQADAAAVREIGTAAETTGRSMDRSNKRNFLYQQGLFTLRRSLYAGTLALGAMGTAALIMGFKFNSSMEQNTVAMTHFLHSSSAATHELNSLFQLAATTPFEFTQVSDAAKRFLAFGFTVQQTNAYLRVLADTASGVGGGADTINRIVLAVGQMQAKGRVMGQELLQLEEVGIPALEILQKQLGLTDDQLVRIGDQGLKASVAIPALMKGLQEQFGGLSDQQAKTFAGQLSTMHDYASQIFGTMTKPLYDHLRTETFPAINETLQAMNKGFKDNGMQGAFDALERSHAPGWLKTTARIAYNLGIIIKDSLIPSLTGFKTTLIVLAPFIWGIDKALGIAADHTTATKWAIDALVVAILIAKGPMLFMAIQLKAQAFWAAIAAFGYDLMWASLLIVNTVMDLYTAATLAAAAAWLWLNIAMYLNPIFIIAGIILAVIVVLAVLYWKWDWFHKKVDLVGHALWDFFGGVAMLIGRMIGKWVEEAGAAIDWLIDKAKTAKSWLDKITPDSGFGFGDVLAIGLAPVTGGASLAVAHAAYGGDVASAGMSWVGENGPELMYLPQSARIQPLQDPTPLNWDHMVGGMVGPVVAKFYLDRKQIGEAVAHHEKDVEARR
jgi:tape measure domain-containing protein